MELFNLIFKTWWSLLGAIVVLGILTGFINGMISALLEHLSIRKLGYPPEWCDSSGNFRKYPEEENEDEEEN